MSADSQLSTLRPPYSVYLSPMLSEINQHTVASLLRLLPSNCIDDVQLMAANNTINDIDQAVITIKNIVDGRGLACPMPLLKTKVALREVADGESLYVVATDPNSQADIIAFCQQSQQIRQADTSRLLLNVNQATESQTTDSQLSASSDTIFHFIITKTGSN